MKLPGTKDSHKDKVSRNPIKIYPSVPKKACLAKNRVTSLGEL